MPLLKDHDGAGVSIALKNMYGVIHNPNKYHPNGCNPYVADVNMLPDIRTKMRLAFDKLRVDVVRLGRTVAQRKSQGELGSVSCEIIVEDLRLGGREPSLATPVTEATVSGM